MESKICKYVLLVERLVINIQYHHYYDINGKSILNTIDYSKGFVSRTPDNDKRVQNPKRALSIVVDCYKQTNPLEQFNYLNVGVLTSIKTHSNLLSEKQIKEKEKRKQRKQNKFKKLQQAQTPKYKPKQLISPRT